MTPKQQVADSAWRRAVHDAEREVLKKITGSWDIQPGSEYFRDGYKNPEAYAEVIRGTVLNNIAFVEAATEELRVAEIAAQAALGTHSEHTAKAFAVKVWKNELEERQANLMRSIPKIDGGKPYTEKHVSYAKRALLEMDQALEKLAIAREGLKKVTNGGE